MGFLSTDIVKGSCVPWGVYSSYAAEKIITSFIFFVALLLPLIMMVFCYYKIVYKLKHTVSVRIFDSTFICSKHDNKWHVKSSRNGHLGTGCALTAAALQLKDQTITPFDKVHDLDITLDSTLTMEAYVDNVVRSCFYQLRQQLRNPEFLSHWRSADTRYCVCSRSSRQLQRCTALYVCSCHPPTADGTQRRCSSCCLVVGLGKYQRMTPVLRYVGASDTF